MIVVRESGSLRGDPEGRHLCTIPLAKNRVEYRDGDIYVHTLSLSICEKGLLLTRHTSMSYASGGEAQNFGELFISPEGNGVKSGWPEEGSASKQLAAFLRNVSEQFGGDIVETLQRVIDYMG